jgi:hypothetical protein
MERPKEMRVTRREAKALLATGGWRKDPELTMASGGDAFTSASGQSMVFLPGRMGADICDDRDAMLAYCLARRSEPPRHLLQGLFPYGEAFPREVPRLIDHLASQTGLARSVLEPTEEGLKKVERAFRQKGGPRAFLDEKRFPAVVAYVGEVLRHVSGGGEWRMKRSGNQWEPWFIGPDGSRYPVFILVHDGLNQGRAGAILALVQGERLGHLLERSSVRRKDMD